MLAILKAFSTVTLLDALGQPYCAHHFPQPLESLQLQIAGTSSSIALAISPTVVIVTDAASGEWIPVQVNG